MNEFELLVHRQYREVIAILVLGFSTPGLVVLGKKINTSNMQVFIPLLLLMFLLILIYYFVFGKLIIRYSKNKLDFEWKKRILFENKDIEPVSISDIKTLVIDDKRFLRKIITNDRIIEINNGKTKKGDYQLFLKKLILNVEDNNGRVIDSKQYSSENGYDDLSFHLTIILFTASIFLISRLWEFIDFYSLLLLLFPILAYLRHINLRIKKKRQL
ncbi:MAG: hypothetical protein PHT07_14400 [Paludibacter sp.]|nr:hypothetical protein [Paludibacter sp.]